MRKKAAATIALAIAPVTGGQTPTSPLPPVSTTRVLAVGHIVPGATLDRIKPVMKTEVSATVRLYLSGKLDQWYTRKDQNGVVFVLNCNSVAEAEDLLEKLPLGQAHLMKFDFIPLGPLSPLNVLLPPATPDTHR